jgi:hypothetical protein
MCGGRWGEIPPNLHAFDIVLTVLLWYTVISSEIVQGSTMLIYTDETQNPRWAFEAVAIRASYGRGSGSNAACYQAKTIDGKWRIITKKFNPQLKIKIARPTPEQWKSAVSDRGQMVSTYTSEEMAV